MNTVILTSLTVPQLWSQTNVFPPSGNVGIGMTSPYFQLDVVGDIRLAGSGGGGQLVVGGGGAANWIYLEGHNSAWTGSAAAIQISGEYGNPLPAFFVEANSSSFSGNVGIGTPSPTDALDVNGVIAATEVKVEATVPDFVFETSYHLQPLSEVKHFVEEHHHLPDIPSAAEVKEKGLSLGDMQAKLLGKIEELTLHMIQAEERNNRLEQEVRTLRERLAQVTPEAAKEPRK